jgi:hypothetical protein
MHACELGEIGSLFDALAQLREAIAGFRVRKPSRARSRMWRTCVC